MSRSHLYRATRPARPLVAMLLATLWAGAALGLYVTAGAELLGGVPLQGPAAAMVERASLALAVGAVAIGGAVAVRELVVGRTAHRVIRLLGATLLVVAGGLGLWDTLRLALRPGTPTAGAAPSEDVAPVVASESVGAQRVLWTGAGLLGAALVLAGGTAALRSRESGL